MSLWVIVLIRTCELLMFPGHAQHPGLALSNNGVKYWCSCHRALHCAPQSGQMLNSAPFLCRTFLHSQQGFCCSLWVRQLEQLGWADALGTKSFCQNNIVSQAYRVTMTIFKPDGLCWPLSHGAGTGVTKAGILRKMGEMLHLSLLKNCAHPTGITNILFPLAPYTTLSRSCYRHWLTKFAHEDCVHQHSKCVCVGGFFV